MTCAPPRTPLRRARSLAAALVAALWAFAVAWAAPSPAATPGRPVVVVGLTGLGAADLDPRTTPSLWALARQGAVGAVAVRSVHLSTCPVDGWLTLGAGARAAQPGAGDHPDCRPLPQVRGGQVPGWADYVQAAAGTRQDARLGSLAAVAARGQRCVQAVGPGAGLAAADPTGHVARWAAYDPATLPTALRACPLTLVDAGGVTDGPGRAAALGALDAHVGQIVAAADPETTVVVVTVADAGVDARLHPVVARVRDSRTGVTIGGLSSASTRQDGVVLLTDLAPTVTSLLGLAPDPSWSGHPITFRREEATVEDRVQSVRDREDAARLVADVPLAFWPTWVLVQLAACLAAWLAGRRGPRAAARARASLARLLLVSAAVPAGTYLAALVPWWRAPAPAATLWAVVWFAAVVLGAVAAAGPWRHHPLGPPAAIAALTALVVGGDALTGSRLTLSTLLGEQPTVAGRFYGLGNVAFALLATSTLLVMVAVAEHGRRRGRPRRGAVLAVALGLAAVAVDGAPWWGADLGGPVALIPAVALLGLTALGVRLSVPRLVATAGLTVGAVCLLALADWLRPAGSRSHLGRFVQTALDGGAGDVVARKAQQNLHILVTAPLAFLVPVGLVLAAWALARPASPLGRPLARTHAATPLLRGGLAAILLMWVVGFAMNDSGTAIPAVGTALLAPLLVAVALRLPRRVSDRDEP